MKRKQPDARCGFFQNGEVAFDVGKVQEVPIDRRQISALGQRSKAPDTWQIIRLRRITARYGRLPQNDRPVFDNGCEVLIVVGQCQDCLTDFGCDLGKGIGKLTW